MQELPMDACSRPPASAQPPDWLFHMLVDAVQDYAIYMLDTGGHLISWNKGAERNKGYTAEEILGQHYSKFFLPEDVAAGVPEQDLWNAACYGHFAAEGWRVRKNGTRFWAAVTLNAMRDRQATLIGYAKITRDLTERKAIEERFRLLVDAVEDYAIYMLDTGGYLVSWNKGAERNKGYKAEEILGRHFRCFFLPEDVAAGVPEQALEEAARTGHCVGEGWRVRKGGAAFWASTAISAIRDYDGRLIGYAKVTRDLSERKIREEYVRACKEEIKQERDRLRTMIQSIKDGVISIDQAGCVVLMNPLAESLTGFSAEQARMWPLAAILRLTDADTGDLLGDPARMALEAGQAFDTLDTAALLGRDGTRREVRVSSAPIRNSDGEVSGAILTIHDVTSMRKRQREIEFSAQHDPLTGLPNRRVFEHRLEQAREEAGEQQIEAALCMIDLDHFKEVNDTGGHPAGDALLREVGALLLSRVRRNDLAARLGGDEFALILSGCSIEQAEQRMETIRAGIEALQLPWEGHIFRISASIGITRIDPQVKIAGMVKAADEAAYAAKRAGKNCVRVAGGRVETPSTATHTPDMPETLPRHAAPGPSAGLRGFAGARPDHSTCEFASGSG